MTTHPVHLDGHLDPHLSRWLWLVKWLLALPHYVVLIFLWLAFVVLSIVAFFAILFTGRYPRSIFDFNVGVLRWSWRVSYYAYGALGTDRYPPFTLADVPDYPAHLEVAYPDKLSRGLVLVKWWLLAIPHYLLVGLFVSGGVYVGSRAAAGDQNAEVWSAGLIGLLVFFAAVALLFTGRYPESIFDLVLGLNRWVLRVAAYAALMTDTYPPFRLDMGGDDPGGRLMVREGPSSSGSGAQAPEPDVQAGQPMPAQPGNAPGGEASAWTVGRVVSLVLGSVLLLVAGGLATGGLALLVVDQTQRDQAGFLMSETTTLESAGFAVASDSMELSGAPPGLPGRLLGDARLVATSADAGSVFVGLAPTADVNAYLSGVAHSTVSSFDDWGAGPRYRETPGGPPAGSPEDARIWEAAASGPGTQTLTWRVEPGDWTIVVMNQDAGSPVAATVAVGATVPGLGWLTLGILAGGGLLLLLALGLVAGSLLAVGRVGRRS